MILFFNHTLDGHRVEFVHHFYEAARRRIDESFVFAYPESDQERMESLEWTPSPNIIFYKHNLEYTTTNKYRRSYQAYKVLKKTIKKLKPKEVFLMDIFQFMPYVAFISSTRISGLIGGIYLYTWKTDSRRKHLEHIVKYMLFARMPVFRYLYVQSDHAAVAFLNKKYKTSKFKYICDPFPDLSTEVRDVKEELGISEDKMVVLHPGFMSSRKGTLHLLKGIIECNSGTLSKYVFVFAGSVEESIKDKFSSLLLSAKEKGANIIFIEGYVSFDYLSSLMYSSDIIFIPYLQTNQSSGIIGYGAKYKKPVVVIKAGLLSKLVRDFKLGYIIDDASAKSISGFLETHHCWTPVENNYLTVNTINNFSDCIINDISVS